MSYRQDMNFFAADMRKRKRDTFFLIKITVCALAASMLLAIVMMIVDTASGSVGGGGGGSAGERDKTAPVITLKDGDVIYLYIGESVAWKNKVNVTDNSGTAKIDSVDNTKVNIDREGTYTVTYHASDSAGNTAKLTVKVVVTRPEYSYNTLMDMVATKAKELGMTTNMSKEELVRKIYSFVNSPLKSASDANIEFVNESNIPNIDRRNWETDWVEEASRTLNSGAGDCYSYYSVSKAFFEYFEIENRGIRRNDEESSLPGTHFWSMVNIGSAENPRWYFYDSTRLNGKFSDGTNNACLRTLAELQSFAPASGGTGFYAFNSAAYPTAEKAQIFG